METELHSLYTVLSAYKQSLLKILNTIDKNILQAIHNYDNTRTKISINKKYKISMEMVEVIQNYVKMLYMGENIIEGLATKFAELEQHTRPERERSNSNPFVRENVIIPAFLLQNRQEVKFEDIYSTQSDKTNETSVISDTETLMNMESDLDIEHDYTFSSLDYSQPEAESSILQEDPFMKREDVMCIENTMENLYLSERENSPKIEKDNKTIIEVKSEPSVQTERDYLHPRNEQEYRNINKNNQCTADLKPQLVKESISQTEEVQITEQPANYNQYIDIKSQPISRNEEIQITEQPVNYNQYIDIKSQPISQTEEVQITEQLVNYNQYIDIKSQPIPQTEEVQITEKPRNINPVDVKPQSPKKPISPKVQNEQPPKNIKPSSRNLISPTKVQNEKPPENIKQDNEYIEVKKKQPRVTFQISLKKEDKKSQSPNKNSAIDKLLKMPSYDWRQECANLLLNKNIRTDFKLKSCTSSTRAVSPREGKKKSKEKPVIFDILESDFGKGQKCVFCYIVSPSEIYVRTDQQLFESFELHLNDEMNKSKFIVNKYIDKKEAYSHLGNFCFAFLRDKQKWFRVEVLDWMEFDPHMTEIQLIDYGERVLCNYQQFKCMIDVYAMFPRLAIRCHFAMIYPSTTNWSPECIKMLNQWCQIETKKNFTCIFADREGYSYSADFAAESDPKSLGQMLVDNGMAFEEGAEYEYLDTLDEEDLDDYNINEAVSGYDAKDEARLCRFTDESGRCFKGPKCKLEHGRLADDGITTDKILTTSQALNQLPLPKPEECIEILIIGYVNTCHFYAQIITEPTESLYNAPFVRLAEAMKANNVVQTYEKFKVLPGIAELVLVKQDPNWFRGSCVGYAENDDIEIFLVDLGYRTVKKLKDLRQMKDDFLHVPFQAVECVLDDCEERRDASVEVSQEFFNNCMHMQLFTALVKHTGQPLQLQMRDSNGMEMGYVLKNYGLGQDRKVDPTPARSVPLICG